MKRAGNERQNCLCFREVYSLSKFPGLEEFSDSNSALQ